MKNEPDPTPTYDLLRITEITSGFANHSLPEDEWTHEAHLITGLSLILDIGLESAESSMPDMIKSYNEARGGINSDTEGYHHTITIFYLRALERFRLRNKDLDRLEMIGRMLEDPVAKEMYPLGFYSKAVLFSGEARLGWVEPDLKQF